MKVKDIQEIEKQYKDEWLLFEVDEIDEMNHPTKGRLLAHSPSRAALYEFLSKHPCPHFYVTFTGSRPQKGIIPVL
ncbi:MAG: hypothetical protein ACE5IR_25740 [bacterium]